MDCDAEVVGDVSEANADIALQGDVVVGQSGWPVAADDTDREVLVDDDHQRVVAASVVIVGAGKQGICVGDLFERLAELVGKITARHPAENLPALVAQTGIASAAPEPPFLEGLISDRHAHQATHPRR